MTNSFGWIVLIAVLLTTGCTSDTSTPEPEKNGAAAEHGVNTPAPQGDGEASARRDLPDPVRQASDRQIAPLPCARDDRLVTFFNGQSLPDTTLREAVSRFVNARQGIYYAVRERGPESARVVVIRSHLVIAPKVDVATAILWASRHECGSSG